MSLYMHCMVIDHWSSGRIMWLVMVRLHHPYVWWFFNSMLLDLVYTLVMLAGQLWSSYVRPVPSLPSPLPGLSPMSRRSTTLILLRPSRLQTFCYDHPAPRRSVMTKDPPNIFIFHLIFGRYWEHESDRRRFPLQRKNWFLIILVWMSVEKNAARVADDVWEHSFH